jgi:hypothetical protein
MDDHGALQKDQDFSVYLYLGIRHTPITLSGPINLMSLSVTEPLLLPWASVSKLPRSPTWRVSSVGAPCVFPNGLTVRRFVSLVQLRIATMGGLTVGTGGCATVCVVTELMDVHATLSIGIMASDVP